MVRAPGLVVVGVCTALAALPAGAVADGVSLQPVVTQHVFGGAVGVGNTLMADNGQVNEALLPGGSEATIPLSKMDPDATVVQAFLVWAGTFDPNLGIPLDRDVDFTLPNGTTVSNLSVDTPVPGETLSPLNRCVSRNHNLGGGVVQPMFECRRDVTFLLQQLGRGGALGTYGVDGVNLLPGNCNTDPIRCEAAFGGWAVVVLWESPSEPVKRDLVVYDAFFAVDEQGGNFGGFSSGIGPAFLMDGFTIGPTADGDITFLGFEGDAQLGVPPQNLLPPGDPLRCNDGKCADFIQVKTNGNNTFVQLHDAANRAGNLLNGSDNAGGGPHPGVDIDTFDIGPSGLNVLRPGDTQLFLQPGSGDGVADDGSGGSGELWLLGMTFLSVETFAPRFVNTNTEKVVLEPVAGAGETLHYILRVGNDGSAAATNTLIRDQLPAGVTYVPGSTTNTCGVNSADVGGTSPVLRGSGLNVGTLAINAHCEVRFNAVIDNDVADGTLLQNFFTVAADGVPPILIGPANTVVQAAQLGQPTKTVSVSGGGAPAQGSTLVYTVRIPNGGARNAPNVRLEDVIPAQLENLQILSVPAGATDNSTSTKVDVTGITVAAGASVDIVFQASIKQGTATGTRISNQGTVTQPSLPQPLPTDDPSTSAPQDPTSITVASGISLAGSSKSAVDVNGGRLQPGDVVQFTVHVQKTGPASTVVNLDDSLPLHMGACTMVSVPPGAFANCAAGGTNNTGHVTGSFAVASGAVSGDFVFRATVDAAAPDGFVLVNTAHLEPQIDPGFSQDVSSPPLQVFARPDFTTSTKAVLDQNGGDPRPNDALTYTITVVNAGSIPAQNVVVTDAVPASLASVVPADGGAVTGAVGAQTVTWTVPSLAVGASAVLHFTARIAAGTPDGTRISNAALVHADAPARDFTTPPAVVVVKAAPLFAVTKTVSDLGPAPFRPGDTVRYTIVVKNNGDGVGTNVVVRDTVDPSFETAITNAGGSVQGGDVVFDSSTVSALSSLAPAASATVIFDARLLGVLPNGTVVSNQARTTSDQTATPALSDDPATATAGDPTRFTVTSQAVIAMKKTFVDDNGGALLPGDTVTYTLTLDDTGDAPATSVVVTDALDARLTFVSSPDGGTFSAGRVTFPAKNVVPGTTATLRFTVRVATGLANGTTIDNQASASSPVITTTVSDDPTTAAPTDPTRIVVVSRPVLDTFTKTVLDVTAAGRFSPGDHVRYTITLQNTGSEAATGASVTDAVPAALTNVVPGQGGAVTGSGGGGGGASVTWTLGSVNVGRTVTLTLDADIVRPFGDAVPVDNQAQVQGTNFTAVLSDDPATTAARDPTRFVTTSKPHLVVQKTVVDQNGGAVAPGDTLAYTITLRNDGGRAAQNVSVTDPVDNRLRNVVVQDGGTLGGGTITWSVASIAVDATATLRFHADLRAPLQNGVRVSNQASAALAEPNVPGAPFPSDDPNTPAPNDPTTVQVISASDLSATTMETVDPLSGAVLAAAAPGATVRYDIEVQNRGTDDGRNVVVRLPLPAQVAFVTSSGGAFNGNVVRFAANNTPALADVAPGDRVTLTVDVRLLDPQPASPAQPISAQATVRANGVANAFVSDDPSTASFGDPTVLDVVALRVSKDASGGRVHAPDDVVTYSITATSLGSTATAAAAVTDVLSPALVDVVAGAGLSFDAATHTISGSFSPLAPGASATLTYSARIATATTNGTRIQNQADVRTTVSGAPLDVLSDDPQTPQAGDPTVITVNATPVLSTSTKTAADVNGAPLLPGDTVRYVVTVVSSGTGSAADVRVTDVVDSRLAIVNVENGGVAAGNTIVWDKTGDPALAVVARGGSAALAFTARVSPTVTNGTVIGNQAQIVSRDVTGTVLTDDPATAAPADPTNVTVVAPQIAVKKRFVDRTTHPNGANDVEPGDAIEYDIEVDNTGGIAATGVVVTDALPPAGLVSPSVLDGGSDDAGLVTWTIPRIDPGTSVTVRVRATVDPLAVGGTVIANSAQAVANEIGTPQRSDDPDTAAPGDATTRTVNASEAFTGTVELFDATTNAPIVTPVVPRQRIRARVTFENGGNQVAQAVVLKVPVDPLRIVVDSTTGGGVIDQTGVRWDASQNPAFARMATGQGATVEFTGAIASPIPDAIDIPVAGLVTTAASPAPVTIGPALLHTKSRPDLTATTKEVIDDDGGLVEPGDTLTYRITVLNDGGNVAPDVHVVDAIPGGTVYVAGSTKLRGAPVPDSGGLPPTQSGLAIGDLPAGRSAVVEVKVRVTPEAPRGLRIDNQAVLRATGVPDAVSDFPGTPLILGDPTPVVVGGGASLVAQKAGAPSPVAAGQVLRFDIHVENVGTEPAKDVEIDDAAPAGTSYVPGSLLVDGAPATDAVDRDDADADPASGAVHLHRGVLEAGQGLTLSFGVRVRSGSVVVNQATVTSSAGTLLTDGDPGVAGVQPTVVPVKNARALVLDGNSITIGDDNGGLLAAGDAVTVHAVIKNESAEHAVVDRVAIALSALLDVDPAAVTDPRFTFDAGNRAVVLKPGTTIDLEDGGGAVDVVVPAHVSRDARVGDVVRAIGQAHAASTDHVLQTNADLGRAELTVGLLPGTAAIQGTLFLDGGPHDGVFQPATDKPVKGMTVLAFWRDDASPVQTAISDDAGHYQLLPIPAGRYRLELRSPSGASFGSTSASELQSGEVRTDDVAVQATGAVYVSGSARAAAGARVFLFDDDGNADPADDVAVDDHLLGDGQQGQVVTAQGLYRFDAPVGSYRIEVEPPDPLTAFPSSSVPVQKDTGRNPFGAFATPDDNGDIVQTPLPDPKGDTTYFLRFHVRDGGPLLQRNFIPVDALQSELTVTKTANTKRASVGDIVSYAVRIDNRALSGVSNGDGGVEVVDTLPFGFQLVKGSYRLDRVTRDAKGQETRVVVPIKDKGGSVHTFGPFELSASTTYELRYNVIVGPGTQPGAHENRAKLRMAAGQIPLSADATAAIDVVPDGTFDLGTIRAKVFCDDNGNGWQDPGELGLPGVRLVADTGQWIDSDIDGKAHFSAIPAGEHVVKVDDRTLPPGTTVSALRQVFQMSSGLPVQIAFDAHCVFVKSDTPEVTVDEAAYEPEEVPASKHHVEGRATPAKLVVDGQEVDLPHVDLGVGVEGADPAFAGSAGPNLPAVVEGALRPRLLLVPRIDGGATPVAWQIVVEALGLPDAGAQPLRVDPLAKPRVAWVFAGRGEPPAQLLYDGKDPATGSEVLFEGQLYRATLSVGFDDGTRATAAPRVFGVRAGVVPGEAKPAAIGDIDSESGELFTASGRPTHRLVTWLREKAKALRGKKITVVVHTDPTRNAAQALTAQRAAAAKKALVQDGLDAKDVEPKGAGDAFPKVPNLRKKDRAMNRRVEILVEGARDDKPPPALAAPVPVAQQVVVNGAPLAQSDGVFGTDVQVKQGSALAVSLTSSTGAVLEVVRGDAAAPAKPAAAPEPVAVVWRPAEHRLLLGERTLPTDLLDVRLTPKPGPGGLALLPSAPGLEVVSWTVRVLAEKDGAPAFAEDDAQIGSVAREISVDGKLPASIPWDGLDNDGKKVAKARARLFVKTASGDVGISPDVELLAPAAAAAGTTRIADPVDEKGKLKPAAVQKLKEIAAAAKDATAVRIQVHTDDAGRRIDRRTRTQGAADAMMALLVKDGVPADRITALGMGSDVPLVPNLDNRARRKNRRAEITVTTTTTAPAAAPTSSAVEPRIVANGATIAGKDGSFAGAAPATTSGEVVIDLRDASGARANLHVRPHAGGELWEGDENAFAAWIAQVAPVDVAAAAPEAPSVAARASPATGTRTGTRTGAPAAPAWYPDVAALPASALVVELPADTSRLASDTLLVRGHTTPENRIRIGTEEVPVDPKTGDFVTVVKLPEGDSDLVVEAVDAVGNTGRIKRHVAVDTTGWFALLLADTAFGGDGADLGERTPYTSLKLGDTFLYGRAAGFVHGRWRGPWLFQHYDLTLDVDTRRWQDDVFDPELIDPERFFPVYGDSSVENVDATRSAFPLYLNLQADTSSLVVGAVRTDLQGGDLFRYQRARSGAQLTFDRGWTTPVDVDATGKTPVASPEGDPWRTRVTTFVAGGGGQQHARVELAGTGSSVYFLRHSQIVEGSEQVAIIVRDAVTGAEIARTPQVRDVDYTIRYDEGRVMFKEPVSAFDDGELTVNQNLGQVANENRVFVEVEYEHLDNNAFMGVGAGAQVKQTILGHAEVGGGYVYEGREDGGLGYQLGGGHLRLYADPNTWIQAELLGSQSVDAGNFVSFDGGLTYSSLGQSLNQKDVVIGRHVFSAERQGVAFKLDGNAQLGRWLGRANNADANLHAYVQEIQPGFFADSSIVEQGETKWGTEGAWQVFDDGKLKLRYDGVISVIPEVPPLAGEGTPDTGVYRTLHREIATLHYEQRVVAPLVLSAEYGYGYTWDSGSFGPSAFASDRSFSTNVVAAGADWQVMPRLTLGLKQEVMLSGDPNLLTSPLDYFITHFAAKYSLTDEVALVGGADFRWSGENQVHAGVSWAVNDSSRVYLSERVGVLPAPVTGTMGYGATTVLGGETDVTPGSTAYAEYQLDGGFAGEQTRGVVGLKTAWRLPFGFALNFGYERSMLIGGTVPTTEAGVIPPGALTDGTFYAAPGANEGGSYLAGQGSRDAVSAAVELHRGETVVASQRFELRYDNQDEARAGHDLLWLLSGSGAAVRVSPEFSLLARYNVALAQDLTLSARAAYFEEGAFGAAFRPVTHDWFSVLAKISRRVDERPISLENGTNDEYTAHALSVEPIVELPWKVQLVEKLALKHASEKLDDVPSADALTGLWINRVNLHTLAMLKSLGVTTPIPGEIDLGLEYRLLAGFTYNTFEQGPLVEVQVAPIEYFRVGVGYNFTHFSDDELDSGKLDRSGFFVRAVGTF